VLKGQRRTVEAIREQRLGGDIATLDAPPIAVERDEADVAGRWHGPHRGQDEGIKHIKEAISAPA